MITDTATILAFDLSGRVQHYLTALNEHAPEFSGAPFSLAAPGKKYTRIVRDGGGGVHAFFEQGTGKIFKPAGWAGPVKYGAAYDLTVDAQYLSILKDASSEPAFAGGYLYAGNQSWRQPSIKRGSAPVIG